MIFASLPRISSIAWLTVGHWSTLDSPRNHFFAGDPFNLFICTTMKVGLITLILVLPNVLHQIEDFLVFLANLFSTFSILKLICDPE